MQYAQFQPPSDADLKAQALLGLKYADPLTYRQLKQQGKAALEQEAERMVARCKRLVDNLERSGLPAWAAWDWARREELALLPQN
jgi:hypothetical protein